MRLSRAVQSLIAVGYPVNRALLSTLSPYLTSNLKRYGDYVVDLTAVPDPLSTVIELPIDLDEDDSV